MSSRKMWRTIGIVPALALLALSCGDPPTGNDDDLPPGLPDDITAGDIEDGRDIFHGFGNCFQCHGPDGTGTSNAPNLTEGPWLHIDGTFDAIVGLVTTGVPQPQQFPGFMPPMGGASLSEAQIRQVAAYVFTISREK